MRALLCITLIGLLAGCLYPSYNEREIHGEWFSKEWTQGGQKTNMKAWMNFNPDSTYRAVFDQNVESGRYWIDGYKLYTQATDAELIVVKIENLADGELELSMNRGGIPEVLIFERPQE